MYGGVFHYVIKGVNSTGCNNLYARGDVMETAQ